MRGARVAKGILADKMFQLLQPNAFPISSRARHGERADASHITRGYIAHNGPGRFLE
jgi:hypothetical protein